MKNNVFQRVDGGKFPIAKQEESSIAGVMSKPEITNSIAQYASERLTKTYRDNLNVKNTLLIRKLNNVLKLYLPIPYPYEFMHYTL